MKNILLIGAGRFGRHIAMQLSQLEHQIMAVDIDEERINDILPFVTNAQIGDSTNAEFLRSLGIGNFDVCIVTIGGSFQNSLETTSLLKELGAKCVVSRAERDVHAKFLPCDLPGKAGSRMGSNSIYCRSYFRLHGDRRAARHF